MLKVNNLVKDYVIDSDTIRVLDGVSFDIKEGEILGIIGRSGGGKSTILKVLRGIEPLTDGSFEIDGLTVRPGASHEDIKQLQKMTAIHLQRNFGLWPGATYENVLRRLYVEKCGFEMLPEKDSPYYDELYEKSMEYLKIVNLDKKAEHFSAVLSGGEKQRLLIARQLAAKPSLLLLDEPATMTCPATKQEVLDSIKNVNEKLKLKTLVVSHLPEVHSYLAHRVLWLEGGRIIEEGEPEEVLKKFMKKMKPVIPMPERRSDKTVIKVNNLSKRYWLIRQGEVLDLDSINLEFKQGEITALIGPSGAGKTTLLHAMDGLVYPDDGEIEFLVDNEWIDMSTYSPKRMEVRRITSIMYQEFALSPHSTIKQQLAYRLGVKGQQVVEEARKRAKELGISDKDLDELYRMTDMPEENAKEIFARMGYTPAILSVLFPSHPLTEVMNYAKPIFEAVGLPLSILDVKPYQMSGGENVRAALALALSSKPSILLLDEPFGDLDPITLRDVANSLKNINKVFNTTIIFVSHHVDFIKEVAQRAILIDKGSIVSDGDPKEVCNEFIRASNARYLSCSQYK
ncbi:ATPase component of various ABC-type transport systems with duplicated ATPase domain [Candidatus Methanoperedens nitroreducens]|uniref:ATPase component of various ABC-type transport systems with duplicated ATPase domain n=1 Tax=Candidatus Methanoperedens nitratireducens TaxID=1392998 RepID=A0A062V193_9EURY|nr:ATP-binding cassette domain-containing protein [Candidatus Methanoperedens nitroreducens]KCZ72881.1 ATPase component of various ABC-type transport systems with duplicated ATPase domain [Candidatus Methanoperedens nitroreducens]MDJ1423191.1 ATP-binding cassette domain-containing protein [Candidatus Methanoperedens sp.]